MKYIKLCQHVVKGRIKDFSHLNETEFKLRLV